MLRVAAVVASLSIGLACSPPRVLIVGLDGANWQVMEPLIEAGYLPTIAGLVASGASFDLDCVPADPGTACFCPPVWTSIATGRRKSDHHFTNFFTPSYQRGVNALWNVLHDYGGRSTLIAYRGTWPPENDADLVITEPGAEVAAGKIYAAFPESQHPGAPMSLTHTKPLSLFSDLGMLPTGVPDEERLPAWLPFAEDRVSMEALLRIADRQAREPAWARVPDLTMVLLHGIDRSEHIMWGGIQSEQFGPIDEDRLLEQAASYTGPAFHGPPFGWSYVPAQYQEADAWLAELFEVITYDYVILVSDHGMTRRMSGAGLSGIHDPEHPESHYGILSITGPGIVENQHLGVATVLDVAPTVAHLLGLPVAQDLPGRVLTQSFSEDFLLYLPPLEVPSWD
jgi:predicted AlkP superfamily phosphohydrolase/phosphomutase